MGRAAPLIAAVIAAGLATSADADEKIPLDPVPVELDTYPITTFKIGAPQATRFGALEWRGGIEIESDLDHFGGLSALVFLDDDGRFATVSDTGVWVVSKIIEDEAGRLSGLGATTLQSLPGPDGRPLLGKELSDAESLALRNEAGRVVAYVGFERRNRVLAFPLDAAARPERPRTVRLPFATGRLRYSKGLETLAFAPPQSPHAGALIAIAERSLDKRGNVLGWIIGGPQPGRFSVRRRDEFDITDGTFLDNGDLLLLERRFRPSDGVAMRIRRIAGDALKPGRTIDGEHLIDTDMAYAIDNMEGLAVRRNGGGEIEITLISDDNFSILQRTLMLRFVLVEAPAKAVEGSSEWQLR